VRKDLERKIRKETRVIVGKGVHPGVLEKKEKPVSVAIRGEKKKLLVFTKGKRSARGGGTFLLVKGKE